MRMRFVFAMSFALAAVLSARAGDGGAGARPTLPGKTVVMVSVANWDNAVREAAEFAQRIAAGLPGNPPPPPVERLLERFQAAFPFVGLLNPADPFVLLVDNFDIGSPPAVVGVARVGDLEAFGAKAAEGGLALEKPSREDAPFRIDLGANGGQLSVLPLADGWILATPKAADARRFARELAGWTPPANVRPVEVTADISKLVELQRDTLDGGVSAMEFAGNAMLAQFRQQVERMENLVDEGDADAEAAALARKTRAQFDAGQRGLKALAVRLRELVDGLAQAGVLRWSHRFDGDALAIANEWWPKEGGAFARMIADIAKSGKAASIERLANLPESAVAALAAADMTGVDSKELDDFFSGFFGDFLFALGGDRAEGDKAAALMIDVAKANRGEYVNALLALPEALPYLAGASRGAGDRAEFLARYKEFAKFIIPSLFDRIAALLPGPVQLTSEFKIEQPAEKVLGQNVELELSSMRFFAPGFPQPDEAMLAWSERMGQAAYLTGAVDGWWLNGVGTDWRQGLTTLGQALTATEAGFGKRAGFAEGLKAAGERPALFLAASPSDVIKAALPALRGIFTQALPAPEVFAAAAALPGGDTVFTLSETFEPDRIRMELRLPAAVIAEIAGTLEAIQAQPVLHFVPFGNRMSAQPAPGAAQVQEDFF